MGSFTLPEAEFAISKTQTLTYQLVYFGSPSSLKHREMASFVLNLPHLLDSFFSWGSFVFSGSCIRCSSETTLIYQSLSLGSLPSLNYPEMDLLSSKSPPSTCFLFSLGFVHLPRKLHLLFLKDNTYIPVSVSWFPLFTQIS